jgi:hypothetical protein
MTSRDNIRWRKSEVDSQDRDNQIGTRASSVDNRCMNVGRISTQVLPYVEWEGNAEKSERVSYTCGRNQDGVWVRGRKRIEPRIYPGVSCLVGKQLKVGVVEWRHHLVEESRIMISCRVPTNNYGQRDGVDSGIDGR